MPGGIPEEEREHQQLVGTLRDYSPVSRRLPLVDRNYLWHALKESPSLLAFRRSGIERFLGNAGVLPDGRPVLTFPGRPPKSPVIQHLCWGSPFGACLRMITELQGEPKQVALQPGEPSFEALRVGRAVVACIRMGKLDEAIEFDYTARPETHGALNRLLDMVLETHAEILKDPQGLHEPKMVRLHSVGNMFQPAYGRLEWLQAGWLTEYKTRRPWLIEKLRAVAADATTALQSTPLSVVPIVSDIAHLLAGNASLADRLSSMKGVLRDGLKASECLERVVAIYHKNDADLPELKSTLRAILVLCNWMELDSSVSDAGRRQAYHDSAAHNLTSWPIRPEEFPIAKDELAIEYWQNRHPSLLFDGPLYLDPGDMPALADEIVPVWEKEQLSIDPRQARNAALLMLDEAAALRRWTIPPRAFVDVKVGPFVGVELSEMNDEVYFVWRTANNRYWLTSVGVRSHGFNNEDVLPADRGGEQVTAVMETLMAALVRDFWVAEERRKIFDVKERRKPSGNGKHKAEQRYVYLPRIRYVSSGLRFDRLGEKLDQASRARHFVRPFLRKAENPSPAQLELAKREHVPMREGFTYVRGHFRGGAESQAIYRSRSAIHLLYDVVEPPLPVAEPSFAADWFGFERAIGALIEEHLGFEILHKAVRGRGDDGIDILAQKAAGEAVDLWLVQCKFYAPNNGVGPAIVRELIGSMTDARQDATQVVRGMIVTTSSFSGDALRLAVKHGIQTIGGDELIAICSPVNRRPN